MKRRGILLAVVLVIATIALAGVSTAAEEVDLFLLMDGSNSISPEDYTMQLEGYASAISNSSVVPQNGNISLCVIMFGYFPPFRGPNPFSGPYYANIEVPLTRITNQTVANSIADTILAIPQPKDHTPMAEAFILANETLTDYVARGITSSNVRQIIDISSDGRPNWIRDGLYEVPQAAVDATYKARDDAIFKGCFDEVNVLGVDIKEEDQTRAMPYNHAEPYNRDFLVRLNYSLEPTNHSGFYMEAPTWKEFPESIREKIRRELVPSLSISKEVSKRVCNRSDVLSYTITYRNDDNVDLTEVVLTDKIPAGTSLVPDSISNGGVEGDSEITWDIGNLPIGDSGTQSFNVTVHGYLLNGTILTNTATIDSNETEPKNASAVTTVIVQKTFKLSAYKVVDKSFASPNDTLSYTVQYSNSGTGTLTDAVITDTIPANTTYVLQSMCLNDDTLTDAADSDNGTYYPVNDTLIWDIGTLAPGDKGAASFKVTINAFVPGGTIIRNTAILTTNETEPINKSAITKVRQPSEVPLLLPVGIAILAGLLSLVALIGMKGRRR